MFLQAITAAFLLVLTSTTVYASRSCPIGTGTPTPSTGFVFTTIDGPSCEKGPPDPTCFGNWIAANYTIGISGAPGPQRTVSVEKCPACYKKHHACPPGTQTVINATGLVGAQNGDPIKLYMDTKAPGLQELYVRSDGLLKYTEPNGPLPSGSSTDFQYYSEQLDPTGFQPGFGSMGLSGFSACEQPDGTYFVYGSIAGGKNTTDCRQFGVLAQDLGGQPGAVGKAGYAAWAYT